MKKYLNRLMSKSIKIVLHDLHCTKIHKLEKNRVFPPNFQESFLNNLKSRNHQILVDKNQNNIHKIIIKT
jgi:hypothetical protein